MKKEIKDKKLESIIEKLAQKSGLTIANSRNILTQNQDWDVAEYLKIKPADLDCLLSKQASFLFAEKFGITQTELQSLIDELGVSFITGMIFSKIMYEKK